MSSSFNAPLASSSTAAVTPPVSDADHALWSPSPLEADTLKGKMPRIADLVTPPTSSPSSLPPDAEVAEVLVKFSNEAWISAAGGNYAGTLTYLQDRDHDADATEDEGSTTTTANDDDDDDDDDDNDTTTTYFDPDDPSTYHTLPAWFKAGQLVTGLPDQPKTNQNTTPEGKL
ncbi:MAG: hypothetical protein Q9216_006271, partial [Gyalolechia sp. 2 TL-2023]